MKTKYFIFLLILLTTTACSGTPENNQMPTMTGQVPDSKMSSIAIPAREHGYSRLQAPEKVFDKTTYTLIKSTQELGVFLKEIEPQTAWNGNSKQVFSAALTNADVDFENNNIFIYYHNEGSGSVRVSVSAPVWENGNAVCNIKRKTPGEGMIGTADMAYYAYAFKVSKEIPEVVFVIDNKRYSLPNQ